MAPSRWETFSYADAEAMLSGTPLIITDIEGTAWAASQDTAIVVPAGNADACADAMYRFIIGDISFSADELEKSRQFILDNYSVSSWGEKIYQVYDEKTKRT